MPKSWENWERQVEKWSAADQIGTTKNSYIVLRTKDDFGREIRRDKVRDERMKESDKKNRENETSS
jgi:hypothetical protein